MPGLRITPACQTHVMRTARKHAQRAERILDRVNTLVAVIALVIYLGMVIVSIYFTAWFLIVIVTCVLLAEVLVFFFVRASLAHFALLRDSRALIEVTE